MQFNQNKKEKYKGCLLSPHLRCLEFKLFMFTSVQPSAHFFHISNISIDRFLCGAPYHNKSRSIIEIWVFEVENWLQSWSSQNYKIRGPRSSFSHSPRGMTHIAVTYELINFIRIYTRYSISETKKYCIRSCLRWWKIFYQHQLDLIQ